MYGLVPYNISPIQQGIQFGHAVVEYSIGRYGSHADYKKWSKEDKTFIILNGGTTNNNSEIYDNMGTMNQAVRRLEDICIPHTTFNEPDLGDQLTAVVFLVDERVWDEETYPNYETHDGSAQAEAEEIFGDDATWILELREFLSQFKLA